MSIKEEAIQLIDKMPDNEVVKVVAFIRGSHGKMPTKTDVPLP